MSKTKAEIMIHTWFEFVQQSVGGGNIRVCMCVCVCRQGSRHHLQLSQMSQFICVSQGFGPNPSQRAKSQTPQTMFAIILPLIHSHSLSLFCPRQTSQGSVPVYTYSYSGQRMLKYCITITYSAILLILMHERWCILAAKLNLLVALQQEKEHFQRYNC